MLSAAFWLLAELQVIYLPYISPISPLCLPYTLWLLAELQVIYLPCISPVSPLYLPCVSPIPSGCSPSCRCHLRLQPAPSTVAARTTRGCSPHHLRLQPAPPTVAAFTTYGCSPHHLWVQVPLQQLTAAGYELVLTGHSLGAIVSIAIVSIAIVSIAVVSTIQP